MNRVVELKKFNIADIKIKKSASNFVYIQIAYVMVMLFLRDVIGLPSAITYLTDVIMVLAFILCFKRIQKSVNIARAHIQFYLIIAIVICMCFGAIANTVKPTLFVWGVRNNLRFFIFFLSCVVLLDKHDVENIFKLLLFFFWANFIITLVQYFALGLRQDYLGGIFGTKQGCNAYTNIFLCLILSYKVSGYFNSKVKLINLIVYIGTVLLIAVFAELKVLYVEFIVIFVIAVFSKRPDLKTTLIVLLGIVGIIFAIWLLSVYDPKTLAFFFDSDQIEYYLSGGGYTNSGDLNRFTAISQIYDMFFAGNWVNTLFGFGLGSCDTSSFVFLQSDFFNQYEYLHYRWFTHAWVFLEQGAIGLILLFLFFISIVVFCIKRRKTNRFYMIATLLFTVTTIIGLIYNSALEVEACYLIAFMVAVPFICFKQREKIN